MPFGYEIEYGKAAIWILVIVFITGAVFLLNFNDITGLLETEESVNELSLETPEKFEPGSNEVVKVVSENGAPVEAATVNVQSEDVGKTNSNGSIEFQTPNSDFTIVVEKEGYEELEKKYQVSEEDSDSSGEDDSQDNTGDSDTDQDSQDQEENDQNNQNNTDQVDSDDQEPEVEIWIDEDYTNIDGSTLEIGFQIQGEASNFEIYANGDKEQEGSVEVYNTFKKSFSEEGEQDITIKALDNGEEVAEKERTFDTGEAADASIEWLSPTSPSSETQPETQFEVDSDTTYDLNYTLIETGSNPRRYEFLENDLEEGTSTHTYEPLQPLPEGEHNYYITVSSEDQVLAEESGSFETTEERKPAEIYSVEYDYIPSSRSDDLKSGQHLVKFGIDAYENIEYSLDLNQTTIIDHQEFEGDTIDVSEDVGNLTSGQAYEAKIDVESLENSKSVNQAKVFQAQ